MIEARVIADSISLAGDRLTTVEAKIHRFVLSELNTHRKMSRNSASSRAIPIEKQIQRVLVDPAFPVEFGSNQKGMQAGPALVGNDAEAARRAWKAASLSAIDQANTLKDLGVHKQVVNRILEPFMWHTVIISATEWDNFFRQRCSELAQPEIRVAAEKIRDAMSASKPRQLDYGMFHLPYIVDDELDLDMRDLQRISAARCARVSYLTHDGSRSVDADLELYDRLITADPPHWSPLEHVARPASWREARAGVCGNFDGWVQLRHLLGASLSS